MNYLHAEDFFSKGLVSHFSGNLNYKESILLNTNKTGVQITDISLGYKIRNTFVLGLNSGIFHVLDYNNNSFSDYSIAGLNLKVLFFEFDRYSNKNIGIESYINLNSAINSKQDDSSFSYYDIGINLTFTKAPYCSFGSGFFQSFSPNNSLNFLCWYYTFGLRF
jgi:hypothetical protein